MRPLAILNCLGKALVRQLGNAVGFGVAGAVIVDVGEEVWAEWHRVKNEQQRREELEAVVQMAAQEFRRQVEDVVRQVAAGQPEEVLRGVSRRLQELPDKLRLSLRRPADPSGLSVPPGLPLRQAHDLASLLSGNAQAADPDLPPPVRVTLTLTSGPDKGRQFLFEERTQIIVGRGTDCNPRFPKDEQHKSISRHHCLFDVNPPDVRVCDMNSVGGTYVNGELLGRRPKGMDRDEAQNQLFRQRDLKDGDEVRLCKHGAAVFRVGVTSPSAGTARACAGCGRDVAGEMGADRPGAFLCADCRNDQGRLLRGLGAARRDGESDPIAIQGYTILKELGRGGMGSVWLARDDRTRQLAAVKVILPQVAADERAVKRFQREMTNTCILKHPNVVRVLGAGFSHGAFFLTLEYCDGGSVAHLMRQHGGTLPLDQAIKITLEALDGLHYAHNVLGPGRGLVHRDIKPANLFLSDSGRTGVAKVGDCGLAKAFDEAGLGGLTRTGEYAGTPSFTARQQVIDFKYAQPGVDVWAMAASLYAMLTGDGPRIFPKGRDPWSVVLETPAIPIRTRQPWLPSGLAEVIDRALVEEPEIPFKTAAEFKQALEAVL